MIKSWASTQHVVALSIGEAEYYGIAKGACEGLGIAGLIEDLCGSIVPILVGTDSSAAKAIATRRGVGKVRHLETRALLVQDQVKRGRIRLSTVPGLSNPVDVFTKYLQGTRIRELLSGLPVTFEDGRHATTRDGATAAVRDLSPPAEC